MNKAVWDKLRKAQQDALIRAARAQPGGEVARRGARLREGAVRHVRKGRRHRSPKARTAQRDAWRKAMEPVYPQIVKETGGDAAAFYAAMEAGRKACAK